ncbi:MAG: SDR family NAD(P)-dependent oxidoreductase, partial [Haliea sp.]|nr:SDR family NAD(P)-dependent oxidoreductase [Haliea sp.]
MQNPIDFTGRVVLVTGGGKGVGRGISERFMAAGADVAICGRTPPDILPAADGREAFFSACDVRKYEQLEALIEAVITRFGRLDVLVNNAGGAPYADAATASHRFHESIIALNLTSALHAAQLANRVMQTQDSGGSIINIASVSTIRPSPGTAAYGAAKAGLVNLGHSLA